jgi:hypothetical protein
MRGFIVAMEYLDAGLGAGAGDHRVPVCEHACDRRHRPTSPVRLGTLMTPPVSTALLRSLAALPCTSITAEEES